MLNYDETYDPPMPVIKAKIHRLIDEDLNQISSHVFIFDSGADVTVINRELYNRIIAGSNITYGMKQIGGFFSGKKEAIEGAYLYITVDDCKPVLSLVFPHNDTENILGRNVINSLIAELDGHSKILKLSKC